MSRSLMAFREAHIYGLGSSFDSDATVLGHEEYFQSRAPVVVSHIPFFYASNSNIEMLFIVDTISPCRLRTSVSSLHLGIIFNLALSCTIFNFL